MTTTQQRLIIGTRGSRLALVQAESIQHALTKKHPHLSIECKIIKTTGDHVTDAPISAVGSTGVFTKELENELLAGRIDVAVHSMKDLPTEIAAGLTVAAVAEREDVADVLVAKQGRALDDLSEGATVLTGSARRQGQLLMRRPDLRIENVRGNVESRLRKLEQSDAAGLIVAAAALHRLGVSCPACGRLDPADFLPAPAQGALAIQIRCDDENANRLVSSLDHRPTRLAVSAERAVLARLHGGCQVPLGVYATLTEDTLHLKAILTDARGRNHLVAQQSGPADTPEALGHAVAQHLLDRGARDIVAQVRPNQQET